MESLRSTMIKRALVAMDFKGTTLKRIRETGSMIRPASEQPEPTRKLRTHCKVTTTTVNSRQVHWIEPKTATNPSDTSAPAPTVLFLHGGAYLTSFLPLHSSFLHKIIDRTKVAVVAPDYPLAPAGSWRDAFRMLDEVHECMRTSQPLPTITILADSAGAGLALAWCMHLRDDSLPLPSALVLMSPWVELSMSNPAIAAIDPTDPYLSPEALQIAGRAWAGDDPIDDWHVSPLHGDFAGLPPTYMFTGSADILHPDALLLASAMQDAGTPVRLHTYEAMMHDWMLFSMPEADRCIAELPLH